MRGSVQQGLKQKRTYKQHLQMYAVAHTEKQQNKNIMSYAVPANWNSLCSNIYFSMCLMYTVVVLCSSAKISKYS